MEDDDLHTATLGWPYKNLTLTELEHLLDFLAAVHYRFRLTVECHDPEKYCALMDDVEEAFGARLRDLGLECKSTKDIGDGGIARLVISPFGYSLNELKKLETPHQGTKPKLKSGRKTK